MIKSSWNWLKFDISKFPTDVHILSRKIGLPNPPSKINYRQCAANPRPTSFESRVTSLGSSQIDAWSRQEFSKREKKRPYRQLHLSKLPNQILARPPTWRIIESEIRTKGGGGKMGIDGVPWTTYKNRGRHALSFAEQTLLIEHWGGWLRVYALSRYERDHFIVSTNGWNWRGKN